MPVRRKPAAFGGRLACAAAFVGVTLLVPGRAAGVIDGLRTVSPALVARVELLAAAYGIGSAERNSDIIVLSDGTVARTITSATLSGETKAAAEDSHPAPVGEDRPADGRLLAEVARRQAELDRREHGLDTRASQIAASELLARQELGELTRMREQIERLVKVQSTAADADMDELVGLYENMKPVQAAAVLGKLDAPKAAAILQRIDNRNAGPILAAMDPNEALAITEEVSQRRASFRN